MNLSRGLNEPKFSGFTLLLKGVTFVEIVSGLEDDGRQQYEEEGGRRKVLGLLQVCERQQLDGQANRAAKKDDGCKRGPRTLWNVARELIRF